MKMSNPPPYNRLGQESEPYPPPQGGAYPPQGGTYPPQGGAYPPQGGTYPPQGEAYPPQGGTYPPQGGAYPPQGGAYGPPKMPAPQPVPGQPSYQQYNVTVQPQQPGQPGQQQQQVIIVGGCPACRVGVLEDDFTCLGVMCAVIFFPIGILCCLAMRQRRCVHCGAIYG